MGHPRRLTRRLEEWHVSSTSWTPSSASPSRRYCGSGTRCTQWPRSAASCGNSFRRCGHFPQHTHSSQTATRPSLPATIAAGGEKEEEKRPQRNQIMVDIGNYFFVQCSVKDGSQVWVNLGCGVVLPMSTAEADVFLQKKEKLLRERAARLSKEALRIKYRIRLVMEAISQLYDRATGQRK
ncbi:hypothetical protein C4B63_442g4 [Trypanosoma cruzi]|uniref:Protein UXT n=1 Tax=Trypanosoma cruzi TaxID=5693 RepID=A0A2V2UJL6_TRYCR|nr:hypothetical protein C4B63_442g4 [Trypanosoma cruzi]